MSFDDRLRDELRRATQSESIDAERALQNFRASAAPGAAAANETVVVPLEEVDAPRRHRVRTQRIVGVAAAIALIAGALAIPFALRDRPSDTAKRPTPKHTDKAPLVNRSALQAVASALDATTGAGSFHVEYTLSENPSSVPTTTTCRTLIPNDLRQVRHGSGATPPETICGSTIVNNNVTTTGSATVNVNPFAMKAVSNVSSFGPVTVRVDDTDYWETAGPDSTTTPTGPGSPISSFASLVESTLGPREGAGAMMGLANPGGYLTITRDAITGAKELGTGTIGGVAVTNYRVNVDPAMLRQVPGLSAEQAETIDAALVVLQREGFTGNTTDVSVDARGFIVHTLSTNNFTDGGSVVSDDTFSMFGCAGAVDLPGRPVSTSDGTCATGNPTSTAATTAPSATPATLSPGERSAITAEPGYSVATTAPTATPTTGPQVP